MKELISEQQLREGVARLAQQIDQCYGANSLTVIAVLTGSVVLLADLIRLLEMPLRVGVVQASSYVGNERRELTVNSDLMPDIRERDVLLVDDILDSGHTLQRVIELTRELGPRSVRRRCAVAQTRMPGGGTGTRLRLFRDSRRIRGGIRLGLPRRIPEPIVRGRIGAGGFVR